MSADNFALVAQREDGKWVGLRNLCASTEMQDSGYTARRAYADDAPTFDSEEEAVTYVDADGYTEYGTCVLRSVIRPHNLSTYYRAP